ncbi:unnamed protein product [Discosporangium mesarthrocarpum]
MDYHSHTNCEQEYTRAICLCGMHNCRSSFMNFTGIGNHNLHKILQEFGTLMTFKTLIQA